VGNAISLESLVIAMREPGMGKRENKEHFAALKVLSRLSFHFAFINLLYRRERDYVYSGQ